MFIIIINTGDPLIFTLGFLTKIPNRFECLHDETGEWTECKKQEICDQNIDSDHYRPDTTDSEYIDNWVSPEKMNLLCEPKEKIGLFGSIYFAGLCFAILILPPMADKFGRRWPVFIGNAALIICMIGLIFTHNIYEAYVYFFLDGISFAGKVIVCMTYVIEYTPFAYHEYGPFLLNGALGPFTIAVTFWYQYIDNSWYLLQVVMLIL
jgi:MFS family permease